jgi:hypothetical protein
MLSPQSVLGAASNPPITLSLLAERLVCLELHFDDPTDLDIRMRELSSLSKAIFTAAKNIEAVHGAILTSQILLESLTNFKVVSELLFCCSLSR